ncbi:hypothetical protein [Niabella ginsengisoli]|uniref:Uncharacterized protein n=1 Tax=Niabella ginsengisoli TaxID=522298 RepID=A0ABS9SI40_9BACT|nr:hypothetical protein [Niabella ginsengisoli]MCH5597981.1 hypothetical protein [Niabella ginsengisoli]
MGGALWDKYTANTCMITYGTGEIGFVVVSAFIGAAEIKGVSTFINTLDKMDAVGQVMNGVFRISGKVLKPVLSASGKGIKYVLREGATFVKRIELRPGSNLYCGFAAVEVNLKNKIAAVSDNNLADKVNTAIAEEGGVEKLPVDESGNALVG